MICISKLNHFIIQYACFPISSFMLIRQIFFRPPDSYRQRLSSYKYCFLNISNSTVLKCLSNMKQNKQSNACVANKKNTAIVLSKSIVSVDNSSNRFVRMKSLTRLRTDVVQSKNRLNIQTKVNATTSRVNRISILFACRAGRPLSFQKKMIMILI